MKIVQVTPNIMFYISMTILLTVFFIFIGGYFIKTGDNKTEDIINIEDTWDSLDSLNNDILYSIGTTEFNLILEIKPTNTITLIGDNKELILDFCDKYINTKADSLQALLNKERLKNND